VTLLDKVSDSEGVLEDITRGESLVCHVKEGEVLLLLADVGELLPLSLGGVNTSGVVSTSM